MSTGTGLRSLPLNRRYRDGGMGAELPTGRAGLAAKQGRWLLHGCPGRGWARWGWGCRYR